MPFMMTRTHGNSVMPEKLASGVLLQVDGLPYTDVVGLAQGPGKTFRVGGGRSNWFHIPIPSVSRIEGSDMYLDQCYAFWSSELRPDGSVTGGIQEIHFWDGTARIARRLNPFLMTGDWSHPREQPDGRGLPFGNTWYPHYTTEAGVDTRFHIYTGFGISLRAEFYFDGNITFHSAGATWVDYPLI